MIDLEHFNSLYATVFTILYDDGNIFQEGENSQGKDTSINISILTHEIKTAQGKTIEFQPQCPYIIVLTKRES